MVLRKDKDDQWSANTHPLFDGNELWFSGDSRTVMAAPPRPQIKSLRVTILDPDDPAYAEPVTILDIPSYSYVSRCFKPGDRHIMVLVKTPKGESSDHVYESCVVALLHKNAAGEWQHTDTSEFSGPILGYTPTGETWITGSDRSPGRVQMWRPGSSGKWCQVGDFRCHGMVCMLDSIYCDDRRTLVKTTNGVKVYRDDEQGVPRRVAVIPYRERIRQLTFSDDHSRLLILGNKRATLWAVSDPGESEGWQQKGEIPVHEGILEAYFSPDGRSIWFSNNDGHQPGELWMITPKLTSGDHA